ncbi:alpha/beta hydrolase [Microbacterium sp.]|uniref:alpha/beta hydrolase n=1 Tax=Microbacterium sp. TaxID=51671 RepID=UPI003C750063
MTLVSPNRGFLLERLEGSTGTMSWWSGRLIRMQDQLQDLNDAAESAQELPGVGQAVTAVREDAGELITVIAADIEEAGLLGRVLQDYSDAFDRHARRANDMIEEVEAAHARWSQLYDEAAGAARAASGVTADAPQLLVDALSGAAEEAAADRDLAWRELSALWAEYERHRADWDTAYDDALAALAGAGSASLSPQERRLLTDLLGADSPAQVLRLWQEHPEAHADLIAAHPDIIGNLDGIPFDVRADANRARLDDLLRTEPPGERRDDLEAILRALLVEGTPRPGLISFDPDGSEQVTAAIAHGDLATASDISMLIPGMNGDVHDLQGWGEAARALNRGVGPGSATVVWFGYDTPGLTEEPAMGRAKDGAAALGSYLDGLRVLAPEADVNVVAHSYGSTTAALAIGSRADGFGVSTFIAVGSAGFPNADGVAENLTNGRPPRVYATLSEDDAVARIGRGTSFVHSVVPEHLDGVTVFDSDGGVDRDGDPLPSASGHDAFGPGAYLQPGSESFYNVTEIIRTGEPGTERQGEGSTEGFWDASHWWISDEFEFFDF